MPTVQHLLAFARPLAARVRSIRRPFRPSAGEGAYRLPHDVRDRLTASLAPFRNRKAAFALATFLARYHSNPARLLEGFIIDRRALADRDELELTEARGRGAVTGPGGGGAPARVPIEVTWTSRRRGCEEPSRLLRRLASSIVPSPLARPTRPQRTGSDAS